MLAERRMCKAKLDTLMGENLELSDRLDALTEHASAIKARAVASTPCRVPLLPAGEDESSMLNLTDAAALQAKFDGVKAELSAALAEKDTMARQIAWLRAGGGEDDLGGGFVPSGGDDQKNQFMALEREVANLRAKLDEEREGAQRARTGDLQTRKFLLNYHSKTQKQIIKLKGEMQS
ncbi:unnamed protein product [Choristocarpus tenellus]